MPASLAAWLCVLEAHTVMLHVPCAPLLSLHVAALYATLTAPSPLFSHAVCLPPARLCYSPACMLYALPAAVHVGVCLRRTEGNVRVRAGTHKPPCLACGALYYTPLPIVVDAGWAHAPPAPCNCPLFSTHHSARRHPRAHASGGHRRRRSQLLTGLPPWPRPCWPAGAGSSTTASAPGPASC